MGEIADDMINGHSCSWCDVYFREEHGYPVVCNSCAEDESNKSLLESGVQRAIYEESG